jgi:hypothetical protein
MKQADYQIPAATRKFLVETGNVSAEDIEAVRIKTREAESHDEFLTSSMVENNDPENVRKLAQSAWDIIVQRRIRERAESEEALKLLAEEGLEAFTADLQGVSDGYVYGSRQAGTGVSAVQRQKAQKFDAIKEKAKSDPAVRAQLVELGILSEEEAGELEGATA